MTIVAFEHDPKADARRQRALHSLEQAQARRRQPAPQQPQPSYRRPPEPRYDPSNPLNRRFKLRYLPPQDLLPPDDHPRDNITLADTQKLAHSIRAHGLLQPVIAQPLPDGQLRLIIGERRRQAAIHAQLRDIPVLIAPKSTLHSAHPAGPILLSLAENEQRLPLDPVERANAFKRAVRRGIRIAPLAQLLGLHRDRLHQAVRILKLPQYLLQRLRDRAINVEQARLINTDNEHLARHSLQLVEQNGYDAEQLRRHLADQTWGNAAKDRALQRQRRRFREHAQTLADAINRQLRNDSARIWARRATPDGAIVIECTDAEQAQTYAHRLNGQPDPDPVPEYQHPPLSHEQLRNLDRIIAIVDQAQQELDARPHDPQNPRTPKELIQSWEDQHPEPPRPERLPSLDPGDAPRPRRQRRARKQRQPRSLQDLFRMQQGRTPKQEEDDPFAVHDLIGYETLKRLEAAGKLQPCTIPHPKNSITQTLSQPAPQPPAHPDIIPLYPHQTNQPALPRRPPNKAPNQDASPAAGSLASASLSSHSRAARENWSSTMRFGFWPGAGNPWAEILTVARHAEASGWDRLWFADHFMPNQEDTSAPVHESWVALTALAVRVPRVRIGHLVSGNTYRHPAVVAKMAAELDIVSAGRFTLGLGAAWQENEHRAYGIPFFTLKERLDRFEEACQLVTELFRYQKTNFTGQHYQLVDAPLEPKPVQTPLPLMIGGGGEKRTLRIAAKYADEWNVWGTPEVLAHKNNVLDDHCQDIGRDPSEIQRSACTLLIQTQDQARLDQARAAGRPVLGGSKDDILNTIQAYIDAGVDELIIPDFTLGSNAFERTEQADQFMDQIIKEFR